MTRFVVDASAVLHLASEGVDVANEHELLAPTLLRSQTLSSLHEAVQRGELPDDVARERLARIGRMRIRLLGDAVLRRRAWDLADRLGWSSTYDAEYIALTQLQADAFVTMDAELARSVERIVATAPIETLRWPTGPAVDLCRTGPAAGMIAPAGSSQPHVGSRASSRSTPPLTSADDAIDAIRGTMKIDVAPDALVLLIGASGSGKSTFATARFRPTEVISSDGCRALVADDPADMSATDAGFEVLHLIASKRLERGRLTVIDATNVRPEFRAPLIGLAERAGRPALALAFDMPLALCLARNGSRSDRRVPSRAVRDHVEQLHASLGEIRHEGFQQVFVLRTPQEAAAAEVVRVRAGAGGSADGREQRTRTPPNA
jgi:predicted kinase/predicted nucleic acid-binding protein